jgi:3-phosphoshikimate 1-carboxyvinyltransferase
MPLAELIEIVPLERPVTARITVPGSKSITNRALILAVLAQGTVTLRGALWSEDTQVMVDSLQRLGFHIQVELDPGEFCNRTLVVGGLGGQIPHAGTDRNPLELFVGNAGTAARFLAALVCLGHGSFRLRGTPRMHERPQANLIQALRKLGYRVDSPNDRLPADIHGAGPRPGSCCVVNLAESSQFASALLLAAAAGGWKVEVAGEDTEEAPYVAMTQRLMETFPARGGAFQIEPDASSASYFSAAQAFLPPPSAIAIADFPATDWQIDTAFPAFLPLPARISRQTQLGDSIMTAMILAPFASHPVTFTDLARLRVQECERVAVMRAELTKCGVRVAEAGDTLTIFPSLPTARSADIATYHDHRVAMCFAILGLKVPGIRLQNPACVKKTFPDFFQKLAAPAPGGLGVTILDSNTGRPLPPGGLFAA